MRYEWTLIEKPVGSDSTFPDNTIATPTILADIAGEYVVSLVVNDGQSPSEPDIIRITVVNPSLRIVGETEHYSIVGQTYTFAPVVVAETDYSIEIANQPDGMNITNDGLSIQWTSTIEGTFHFSVKATDASGQEASKIYTIKANNPPPLLTHEGDEFWLMFNSNFTKTNDTSLRQIVSITTPKAANITINVPGAGYQASYTTSDEDVLDVDLTEHLKTMSYQYGITHSGVHILSDQSVSVHALSIRFGTSDTAIVFPSASLGTEYQLEKYNLSDVVVFGIIATENDTVVSITPEEHLYSSENDSISSYFPRHETNEVVLQQGESIQLRTSRNTAFASSDYDSEFLRNPSDVVGSRIASNKPIGLFSGAKCTNTVARATCDHLYEMQTPTDSLGSTYVTVPFQTRNGGDIITIFGKSENTFVTLKGDIDGEGIYKVEKGGILEFTIDEPLEITSSAPISVGQVSQSARVDNNINADPFWLLVASKERFLTSYTLSPNPESMSVHYVNIVSTEESKDFFVLNGEALTDLNWTYIDDSEYVVTSLELTPEQHIISNKMPFGLTSYGFGFYNSYGHLTGGSFTSNIFTGDLILHTSRNVQLAGKEVCLSADTLTEDGQPAPNRQIQFKRIVPFSNEEITSQELTDAFGKSKYCFTTGIKGIHAISAISDGIEKSLDIEIVENQESEFLNLIIESLPEMDAYEGVEYQYQVIATDPNPSNVYGPIRYYLNTAPIGMDIDSNTGLITWIPEGPIETSDKIKVQIEAYAYGYETEEVKFVRQTYFINGMIPPVAPEIDQPPVGESTNGLETRRLLGIYDRNRDEEFVWSLESDSYNSRFEYSESLRSTYLYWTPESTNPGQQVDPNYYCELEAPSQNIELETVLHHSNIEIERPVIGPLFDSNSDGRLDEYDQKYILGITQNNVSAMSLDSGKVIWRKYLRPNPLVSPALINLESSKSSTFVFMSRVTGELIALNSDGSVRWTSDYPSTIGTALSNTKIIPADLDNNGTVELIVGPSVFSSKGKLLWEFPLPDSSYNAEQYKNFHPEIVDLNLDGQKEIIFAYEIRNAFGDLINSMDQPHRYTSANRASVGNFDSDPYPEFILSESFYGGHQLRVFDSDGEVLWSASTLDSGQMVVSDFDNDGLSEVYLSAVNGLYDTDGSPIWGGVDRNLGDRTSFVADLNADGYQDIVSMAGDTYILDGLTGKEIFRFIDSTDVGGIPLFADIDNDNSGEIIIASGDLSIYRSAVSQWPSASPHITYQAQSVGEFNSNLTPSRVFKNFANRGQGILSIREQPISYKHDVVVRSVGFSPEGNGYKVVFDLSNRGLNSNTLDEKVVLYRDVPYLAENKIGDITIDQIEPNSHDNINKHEYSFYVDSLSELGDEIFAVYEPSIIEEDCSLINNIASSKTVGIRLTDKDLLFDTQFWARKIIEGDEKPQISSSPVDIANVGEPYIYKLEAQDPNLDDELRYYFNNSVPSDMLLNSKTGLLQWIPKNRDVGTHHVKVYVVDLAGNTDEQSFNIMVESNGEPQELPTVADQEFNVASNFAFTSEIVANSQFGPLSYSLVGAPSGLTINPLTGELSWSPGSSNIGVYSVNLVVTDALNNQTTVTLTINVNESLAPVVTSSPHTETLVFDEWSYQLTAYDPEGKSLSYKIINGPNTINISDTGHASWVPDKRYAGENYVVIRVTDSDGAYFDHIFSINVLTGLSPQITSNPPSTGYKGLEYVYPVTVLDADSSNVSLSIITGPEGMSLVDNKLLKWTVPESDLEPQLVQILATDDLENEATQEFYITIKDQNNGNAPRIVSEPVKNAKTETAYQYQLVVDDPDNDLLSFELISHPVGMSVSDSGLIEWSGETNQIGIIDVVIRVTDPTARYDQQVFEIFLTGPGQMNRRLCRAPSN